MEIEPFCNVGRFLSVDSVLIAYGLAAPETTTILNYSVLLFTDPGFFNPSM